MKTTTKILALCAAAICGMSARAQSGIMINDTDYLTEATYSYGFNGNMSASTLLGGTAKSATGDTGNSSSYVTIRDSESANAAQILKNNWNPYYNSALDSSVNDPTATWSLFVSARISAPVKGILWALGGCYDSNGLALYQNHGSVVLATFTSSGTVTPLVTAETTYQYHNFTVISTGTKLQLWIDTTKAGEVDTPTLVTKAWQFGGIYQGSGSTGLVKGSGAVLDEFGFWTTALSETELTALAKAFPVWPTDAEDVLLISDTKTYDEVKDTTKAVIKLTDSGVLDLSNAFTSMSGISTFLSKVTGTGTIVLRGSIDEALCASALANTGCTIKMNGFECWVAAGSTACNIILEDYENEAAFVDNGANSGATYTFSGKISGSGSFKYSQTDGRTCTFALTGDLSDWTGNFVNCNNSAAVKVPEGFDKSRITINSGRVRTWTTADSMTTYKTRAPGSTVYYKNGKPAAGITVYTDTAKTTATEYDLSDTLTFSESTSGYIYFLKDCGAAKIAIADGVTLKAGHDDATDAGRHNIPINSTVTIGTNAKMLLGFWGNGAGQGNPALNTMTINGTGTWAYDSGDANQLDLWGAITGTSTLTVGANQKVVVHGTLATPVKLTGAGATLQCNTAMAEGLVTTDLEGYTVVQNGNTYTVSNMYTVKFTPAEGVTFACDGATVSGDYSFEYGATVTFTADYDDETLIATITKDGTAMTPAADGSFSFTMGKDTVTITATTAEKPEDFPFNEGSASKAVKENYKTWKQNHPTAGTTATDAKAFLLNTDPATVTDLKVATITITDGKVVITANYALDDVNGEVKLVTADTVAGLETAEGTVVTANDDGEVSVNLDTTKSAGFYRLVIGYGTAE